MFKISASIIGIIIAFMLSINGVLAGKIGNLLTLPVIHLAGLGTVSLLLLFLKEKKLKGKVPLLLNTGGLIGVLLVLTNNLCFETLGASLTLSLGILGQTLGSVLADSTGFLGLQKYRFDMRKLSGFFLLLLGIIVMTESWQGDMLNIILAFIAGVLVILSMIINSRLALKIGVFHGVQRNYLVGLFASIVVLSILRVPLSESINTIFTVNPLFLLGGGFLGVLVVAGVNTIIPRIPVVYTTLLLFGGQAVAGILIDYFIDSVFSIRKLIGVIIILSGLFLNMLIDKSAYLKSAYVGSSR